MICLYFDDKNPDPGDKISKLQIPGIKIYDVKNQAIKWFTDNWKIISTTDNSSKS